MKVSASREHLLEALQSVIGVVERRQTMPILSNALLSARDNHLRVTGTDLEVELVAAAEVSVQQPGDITVPGRKLLDIVRTLPEKTQITMSKEGERVVLRGGRSRFTLSSLPAAEFPVIEEIHAQHTVVIKAQDFRQLIDKTHFAMAQQDVRYYLNGTLLETNGEVLRAVATDGHRLSWCEVTLGGRARELQQIILPRKGVLELQRLLDGEGEIEVAIGTNHVRVQIGEVRFTSKLIDGKFPEWPLQSVCGSCPAKREGIGGVQRIKRFVRHARSQPRKPLSEMRCLLERGYLCMGPVTVAGCAGVKGGPPRCIEARVPCRGCHGPVRKGGNQLMDILNALASNGIETKNLPDRFSPLRFSGANNRLGRRCMRKPG